MRLYWKESRGEETKRRITRLLAGTEWLENLISPEGQEG